MSEELDKICTILDKLTIDSLTLMQETISHKVSLEHSMSEGEINLAKSRYIMGHNKVSPLQLPTENSQEIEALMVVNREKYSVPGQKVFDLEMRSENEENSSYTNPIKWFGVLVPQNLHQAQIKFRQALQWITQTASLQVQLQQNCHDISVLRAHKNKLINIEE